MGYRFVYKWANLSAGKFFYKNAAGFKHNYDGNKEMKKFKRADFKIRKSLEPKINELKTLSVSPSSS